MYNYIGRLKDQLEQGKKGERHQSMLMNVIPAGIRGQGGWDG
jgi:hypothetical protein